MTDIDRRTLGAMLGTGLLGAGLLASGANAAAPQPAGQQPPAGPSGAPSVTMLVHPGMVMLDLVGPLTVFSIIRSKIELVWKDRSPVMTDCRLPITATHDFTTASAAPDILFIPGGTLGSALCMNDPAVMEFVRNRGEAAKYVTSVCTGSLVLAAAGLLKGYRATSLWAVADLLPLMGATHVDERVVIDRNRITAGGVTAGIDFALLLAAKMTDEETAKRVQLTLEYSPQPPFKAGTPAEAGEALTNATKARRKGMDEQVREAAMMAAKRLNI